MKKINIITMLAISLFFVSCANQEKQNTTNNRESYIVTEDNFPKVKFQFINSKSHGLDRMEAAYKTPDLEMKKRDSKSKTDDLNSKKQIKELREKLNQLEAAEFSEWESKAKDFDEEYRDFESNYKTNLKSKTTE